MNNKKDESKNQGQTKKTEVKASYPIILGKNKGRLILNDTLVEQINTLHNHVGAKEWSGPVLYSISKGDINSAEGLEVHAHAMYPMNIGTAGYTEYEFEPEETFDMHDYYPEIMEKDWRMGHMHTHHSMKAYFSGTDDQELRDNTENHAYYLSLIVNFAGEYVARLCVMAKKEITGTSGIKYQNIVGEDATSESTIKQEQDIVYAIDLDVIYEKQEASGFMGEVLKIAEREAVRKAERAKSLPKKSSLHSSWSGGHDNHLGSAWGRNDSWNGAWSGQATLFNGEGEDVIEDLAKEFVMLTLTSGTTSHGYIPSQMMAADLNWTASDDDERELYITCLDEGFNEWYQQVFNDTNMLDFEDNMDAILEELFKYTGTHPLADKLTEHLEQYTVLTQ